MRGLQRKCPACGDGRLFAGYLKVAAKCTTCSERCGHIRADDIPAYLTILLVGHIVVPLVLIVYQTYQPTMWISMIAWPAVTLALTLGVLPLIKGATVGVMWALRLRGDEQH